MKRLTGKFKQLIKLSKPCDKIFTKIKLERLLRVGNLNRCDYEKSVKYKYKQGFK